MEKEIKEVDKEKVARLINFIDEMELLKNIVVVEPKWNLTFEDKFKSKL